MVRKIFRTGNSMVVSIPGDLLDYLGISAGSEVDVELDRSNHQIIVRPIYTSLADAGIDDSFARQVSEFIEEYRPALEELAR